MNYYFSVADTVICCQVPYEIKHSDCTQSFLCDDSVKPDLFFQFRCVEDISDDLECGIWQEEHHFIETADGFSVCHYYARGKYPYAKVYGSYDHPEIICCDYLSGSEKRIYGTKDLINLLGIESFLLRCNGFMLHSSFIKWEGKGILFSAPSGTGKSTQAELWRKYYGADVINGDRAGVCYQHQRWIGWGLPFAGTSGIYRNESAPISAIVVLRQAKQNSIRRLLPGEALRCLYPEISIHRWDSRFTESALNLAIQCFSEVPVYLLECLPDQGAVDLLKQEIEKVEKL